MISIILGFVCVAIGLAALALQRLYSAIPAHELKRLAARHDHLAARLFRPVAYGINLRLFLWMIVALPLGMGLLLITRSIPVGAGLIIAALILTIAFVVIPNVRLTVRTAGFAAAFAPLICKVMSYLVRPLDAVSSRLAPARDLHLHSRLYEKGDLLGLLSRQKDQHDNRIAEADLIAAHHALAFSDRRTAEVVLPRKNLKLVSAGEAIGPILLSELHKSGQTSFLVYEDKPEHVVGTLHLRDAVKAREGGKVLELMRRDLCYVHEDFSLTEALRAMQHTKHHTAVVINSFREFIGLVTFEQLLNELVGGLDAAPEANYEDIEQIAAYKPAQQTSSETEETTIDAASEPLGSSDETTVSAESEATPDSVQSVHPKQPALSQTPEVVE